MKKYEPVYPVTKNDRKRYVLSEERDLEILDKCKRLERIKLSENDKRVVKLIKFQLIDDWRVPLIKELDSLLKKHKIN